MSSFSPPKVIDLEERLRFLNEEVAKLEAKKVNADSLAELAIDEQLRASDSLDKARASNETMVAALSSDREKLEDLMRQAREEYDNGVQRLAELKKQQDALTSSLESLKKDKEEAVLALRDAEVQVTKKKSELVEVKTEKLMLDSSIEVLADANRVQEIKNQRLAADEGALQEKLSQAQTELRALTADKEARLKDLDRALAGSESKKSVLEAQKRDLALEISSLAVDLDVKTTNLEALKVKEAELIAANSTFLAREADLARREREYHWKMTDLVLREQELKNRLKEIQIV